LLGKLHCGVKWEVHRHRSPEVRPAGCTGIAARVGGPPEPLRACWRRPAHHTTHQLLATLRWRQCTPL